MSLSTSLSNALSGLGSTGKLAEITSNNLANALTKGYGRQSVDLGSLVLDGRGSGVAVRGISRTMAPDITAARRQADADAANATAQATSMSRLGRILGEAGDTDSLFTRLETFEAATRQLAENPEAEPRQLAVIEASRDLTGKFNRISAEISSVREGADGLIADQVATVNSNLDRITKLNQQIERLSSGGRDVATLIDQRELLIDEVSAIVPARVHLQDNNVVHLSTAQGLFLVGETPAKIDFTRSPTITAPMVYDPLGGGALSGISLHGIDITPTSGHPQSIEGGSLTGHFRTRDQDAVFLQSQMDAFAGNLVQRFEDPLVDPTLSPGNPGLFTDAGSAFDPLTIDGLAGRITINVLADPSQGGDASRLRDGLQSVTAGPTTSDTIPRALLSAITADQDASGIPGLAGNLSSSEMLSGVVEHTGIRRTDAEGLASALAATRQALATSEGEQIGVNSDRELQNLIQIEQAFAANVQVIQAASRMLDEILEIR